MLDDLLKSSPGHAWKALVTDEQLRPAIITSLELAALTVILMVVLLVPTRVWVRLRVPWMARTLEFLCLLPLTSPAPVIVVGLAAVYAWVTYFLADSALTLTFAYVVLVLPYAFRAIDAGLSSIDLGTLSEAARSLGASWFTVMVKVVLGEYTFASLLNYNNLQVVIAFLGKSDAPVSVAESLASLIFAFGLLLLLSLVGRFSRRGRSTEIEVERSPAKEGRT